MVPYRKIFEELEKRKIRYLVAGGFAVNFHLVQRATVDLDLIIHLKKQNVLAFTKMMTELGFVPRVPVKPEDFADKKKRQEWIKSKGAAVFSFINPRNPFETVDIFMEEPFPFDKLWKRRFEASAFGYNIKVLGKKDLILLKEKSGRAKDLFDIQQLKKI